MPQDAQIQQAQALFQTTFGHAPSAQAYAPGRVNLMGEHTDYNGGVVFPMPLALGTAVTLSFGGPAGMIQARSADFSETVTRPLGGTAKDCWTDYLIGTLQAFFEGHPPTEGLQITVATNLPVGSGLSSSAALEVALLRAMCQLTGRSLTPVEIAIMARRAENTYVGMPCGIMDQYSVSVGTPGSALFLDTRQLTSEPVALPDSHNFVIIHSGLSHRLSEGGYEKRVTECTAACAALGVDLLGDLSPADLPRITPLPDPLNRRARHIITENDRVYRTIDALKSNDPGRFAALMTESHQSQSADYAVSLPEIDALVTGAIAAGADGARLTGGGFGGSIVAFVEKSRVASFTQKITKGFPNARVLAVT
jgi:galactokinase